MSEGHEESLSQYADRAISEYQLSLAAWVDQGWVEKIDFYIRRALKLLGEVPRDNPFWDKTNKRPTIYKANLWFTQVLEANPDDSEARWVLASLAVADCQYGTEALLAPLVRHDPTNLRWLVGASVWILRLSGLDQADSLRKELVALRADPRLEALLVSGAQDSELRQAIEIARRVLAGDSIHQALDRSAG